MHSLHYKNLPVALSFYCHQPSHSYSTRYATSSNYVLPHCTTNRGQNSIKFTGPKVWSEVPLSLKDVAFRKPFSKKLKDHILKTTYVEMPQKRTKSFPIATKDEVIELKALFESDEEEGEFYGFNSSMNMSLTFIFQDVSDGEEFLGF